MKKAAFKSVALDALTILAGSLLVALGLIVFTVPNNIAPGGVSGLATVLASVTGWPVGALNLALNVPLLVICAIVLGVRPLVKTIAATALLSLFIDLLQPYAFTYTGNTFLAAVLGGAVIGAGMGLLFIRGVTTGGTDLVALLMRAKFPNASMSSLVMIADALVVLVAVLVFRDLEVALYSGVTIFCTSKVIDALQQGIDYAKVIYIVTAEPEAVLEKLAGEMERGVTELPARGGFTREEKSMLMTVARRNEVAQTLQAVKAADRDAFIILVSATEVHGEGFKELR